MNEAHKASIRKNTVMLVDELELDPVLDFLSGRQTITRAQYEELMPRNKSERRSKVREFLGTLVRRGPAAFDDFVDALIDSDQSHLAKQVSPDKAAAAGGEQIKATVTANVPADETSAQDKSCLMEVKVKPIDTRKVDKFLRDNQVYRMTSPHRGRVLLINNEKFNSSSEESSETLRDRDGTAFDEINVNSLFRELHFDVCLHHDQTAEGMRSLIQHETEQPEHQNYGMFVLIILSHGEQGKVYGVDGKLLPILDIKRMLGSAKFKHMAGKPKLILLQACQGGNHDGQIQQDGPLETDALTPGAASLRPDFADMLIAYPTSEGNVSYRDINIGSWFIRAVVEVFMEKAHADHIVDMLTEVRRCVCLKSTEKGRRQGTYDENHLHKKLYLLPGWTEQSQ